MSTIAIQYLEPSPETSSLPTGAVRAQLRATCAVLPVDYVLIGWDIPSTLLDLCAEETARAGARLMRWHPLLTGDGTVLPRPQWQVIGLNGRRVPGFQDMPEFTFMCPNQAAVRNAVFTHLQEIAHSGVYAGIFLDRMRFPSPATNPEMALSCFFEQCAGERPTCASCSLASS